VKHVPAPCTIVKSFRFAVMTSATATAVVIVVIFGCLLMRISATNEEPGVTDRADAKSSEHAGHNVTEASEGCPPRTHHVALRYIVAKLNFSHVQTPFIVAAWILFVTLAKIGDNVAFTITYTCRLLNRFVFAEQCAVLFSCRNSLD